jgi:hypothetical protein
MKANAPKGNGQSNPLVEFTNAAMKNYEQAMTTGLKLQEEAGRWWSSMLDQTACGQDWQKRFGKAAGYANEFLPVAQERLGEFMAIVEHGSRTGTELMKQAIEAAQTPVIADSQAKWLEWWTSSLSAVRTQNEALAKVTNKAVDSWIDFVQKNTEVTEIRVPKAA